MYALRQVILASSEWIVGNPYMTRLVAAKDDLGIIKSRLGTVSR
jgi:hypothetical protein